MKYFLIIILFIYGCKNYADEKLNEKAEDISHYFKNELNFDKPQNEIIVILQNQTCSSCRLSIFQSIAKQLEKSTLAKTFILAKKDSVLLGIISKIPNSHLCIDSLHKLKDYGLDYATDLFFLYKGGRLKKWFEISNENLESIKKSATNNN